MKIHETREAGRLILAPEGRLDTVSAPELLDELKKQLPAVSDLVIDLEKTDYISSAGLRALLYAHQELDGRGTMVVRNANDLVTEVFEVTGFTSILNLE